MSTKTIGVVGRGSGWQKVGIELGSYVFNPNSSQPGMFQTFAVSILSCTYFVQLYSCMALYSCTVVWLELLNK